MVARTRGLATVAGAGPGRALAKLYQGTLNLPTTALPMHHDPMRVDPALRARCTQALYRWQDETRAAMQPHPFVLHDGPPYANGRPHVGHALNRILKDFVVRFRLMRGDRVSMVPGWDCHGLPIEIKALERLKASERSSLTPVQIRQHARALALEAIAIQRSEFMEWDLLGEWERPYRTLDAEYEAAQIGVFGQMVDAGLIYRDFKPVYWSPSSRTALAEAELEYVDDHRSESVYVGLPVDGQADLALLVWTTTPWTLPANQAVAVSRDIAYCVAAIEGRQYVVARPLLDELSRRIGQPVSFARELDVEDLLRMRYCHPFNGAPHPVLAGAHVSDATGTGLVHSAPAHGLEDYKLCREHGIGIEANLVDDLGRFNEAAGPELRGHSIHGEGTQTVLRLLTERALLLKHVPFLHRYPYDWRTKKPVILRATAQWFCSLSALKDAAVREASRLTVVPPVSLNRLSAMLAGRDDWCISRQRAWGVPIPVFYRIDTGESLLTRESVQHVQRVFAEQGGSDCWWTLPLDDLLPPSHRAQAASYRRGDDTMDVWFDSGVSWSALCDRLGQPRETFASDVLLEGSDQHRGWFQSSLLTSVAARGFAPYRKLITHGFVLDADGRKMSKSLGNIIEPNMIILGGKDKKRQPAYGVDVLRLWVASTEYTSDVAIGPVILDTVNESFRKIRNTMRFMLGNLHDFADGEHARDHASLWPVDRYMLHLLAELVAGMTRDMEHHAYHRVHTDLAYFASVKLSSFYFNIVKDRLYADASNSHSRRAAQRVLFEVLHALNRAAAVLVPATAESVYEHYRRCLAEPLPSVAMHGWPQPPTAWTDSALAERFGHLVDLRDTVLAAIESQRAQGVFTMSQQTDIVVRVPSSASVAACLDELDNDAHLFFGVARVAFERAPSDASVSVAVAPARAHKCPRCWNYHSASETALCVRCTPLVPAAAC